MVVVLNTGNILDLNFIKTYDIDGLILGWHGGQDGARALVDVITGYISPSGKLPMTIPSDLSVYPALKDFGHKERLYYQEDIYVGYRFYETFYPDKVLYAFGYGLSYTTFNINLINTKKDNNEIMFCFNVENRGIYSGKEVIELYVELPQGKLGKPKYTLAGFIKTNNIKPNEKEELSITINLEKLSSYDDAGYISKSAYVLEKGLYKFYYGTSVKNSQLGFEFKLDEFIVVEQLKEAMRPNRALKRIKPNRINGAYSIEYEYAPIREKSYEVGLNILEAIVEIHKDLAMIDVYKDPSLIDTFVHSLEDEDLFDIVFGEGMSSLKVTSGTASAFGGITNTLQSKGIPAVCCADGPSGIRMDSGGIATSLPNGTLIASTFNPNLIEDLYYLEAQELKAYDIDILLGPGMNIQRHPLNGRNFEYFSEDPLLTGIMASSVVRGLQRGGTFGAMKHFAANNQETSRTLVNSIVSERALREIYLKGFEIAVKESDAQVIMTSYNPINDIWTASHYELNTQILREEWGFKGIVMTDWWAQMNDWGQSPSKSNIRAMVQAQNDLYMVVPNVKTYEHNLKSDYESGRIKRTEIERVAKNIIRFVLKTPAFKKQNNIEIDNTFEIKPWYTVNQLRYSYPYIKYNNHVLDVTIQDERLKQTESFDLVESNDSVDYALLSNGEVTLYNFGIKTKPSNDLMAKILENIKVSKTYNLKEKYWEPVHIKLTDYSYSNSKKKVEFNDLHKDLLVVYHIKPKVYGKYIVEFEISSLEPNETQMPFSVYVDAVNAQTLTTNGTNGQKVIVKAFLLIDVFNRFISLKFHKTGLRLHKITIMKHG